MAITDAIMDRGFATNDVGLAVTEAGMAWLAELGRFSVRFMRISLQGYRRFPLVGYQGCAGQVVGLLP